MSKPFPIINLPEIPVKEVSSPEFYINVTSNSPGKIIYQSNNENIARINEYGFVSIVCAGNVEIFITQEETEFYNSLELCVPLYIQKSDQKLILRNMSDGTFLETNKISTKIDDKFFDIEIVLNSGLTADIFSINSNLFDFEKRSNNIYRIFPKKIGRNFIFITAKGNNCFNDLNSIIEVEILENTPIAKIELLLSSFTQNVQHDALDEFTLITSNSGQQQLSNSIILQTTLNSKIGDGYSRDIGIINTNPINLIQQINDSLQNCCNIYIPTGTFILPPTTSSSSSFSFSSSSSSSLFSSSSSSSLFSSSSSSSLFSSSSSSVYNIATMYALDSNNCAHHVVGNFTGFDAGTNFYPSSGYLRLRTCFLNNEFTPSFAYSCPPPFSSSSSSEDDRFVVDLTNYYAAKWVNALSASADGKYIISVKNARDIIVSHDYGKTWFMPNEFYTDIDGKIKTENNSDYVYMLPNIPDLPNYGKATDGVVMSSNGKYVVITGPNDIFFLSTDYGVNWRRLTAGTDIYRMQSVWCGCGYYGYEWIPSNKGFSYGQADISDDGKYITVSFADMLACTGKLSSGQCKKHWQYGVEMSLTGNIAVSNNSGLSFSFKGTFATSPTASAIGFNGGTRGRGWVDIKMSRDGKNQIAVSENSETGINGILLSAFSHLRCPPIFISNDFGENWYPRYVTTRIGANIHIPDCNSPCGPGRQHLDWYEIPCPGNAEDAPPDGYTGHGRKWASAGISYDGKTMYAGVLANGGIWDPFQPGANQFGFASPTDPGSRNEIGLYISYDSGITWNSYDNYDTLNQFGGPIYRGRSIGIHISTADKIVDVNYSPPIPSLSVFQSKDGGLPGTFFTDKLSHSNAGNIFTKIISSTDRKYRYALIQDGPMIMTSNSGRNYNIVLTPDFNTYRFSCTRKLSIIENSLIKYKDSVFGGPFLINDFSMDVGTHYFPRFYQGRFAPIPWSILLLGRKDLDKVRLLSVKDASLIGLGGQVEYRFNHEFISPIPNSNFGCAVGIDVYSSYKSYDSSTGSAQVLIGASKDSNRGAIYVYEYGGFLQPPQFPPYLSVSNVNLKYKLTGNLNSNFGTSFHFNSGSLLVGAPKDNFNNGSIYYYKRNNNGEWIFKQKIDTPISNGEFGISISRNYNGLAWSGNNLVPTYPLNNNHIFAVGGTGNSSTGCLVYTLNNTTDLWSLKSTLTGNFNSKFGYKVAMDRDGHIITIGAPYDSTNGINAGAVYIYTGNHVEGWRFNQKLTGNANSLFGSDVIVYGYLYRSGYGMFSPTNYLGNSFDNHPFTKSLVNIMVSSPGYNQNSGAIFTYRTPFMKPYDWTLYDILENKIPNSKLGTKLFNYIPEFGNRMGSTPKIVYNNLFLNSGFLTFSFHGSNNQKLASFFYSY